ncbi:predicted protein [Lichtheimia corymbifera JMRC:FSU:9682]|uniref:Major facilitator superfamily associated domain-containing protein n=1 Tax=Lichtheimia corymbifera JMRC:FSU:9682 TaxID=1263082 RepID=A0A068S069_9FUNG|nr:predicted protein [Lichtheimia corymbifera JMRC:FSU:9682]
MFFWPKLLAMALAVAGSVEHYLALYLWHIPSLNLFAIGMLIALVMVVRLLASTVFIWLVDRSYPAVHLHMLLALTIVGTIALLGVFSMSAFDTYWIMILTLCWMLANGLFFQPLASLVDSAIIKSLGDYKIWLYDGELQWAKVTSAISLMGIGCASYWWFDDDLNPWLLSCTLLMGSIGMCVVLLFMHHYGLGQLECMDDNEENPVMAPRFLKNAVLFPHCDIPYKPYSLFGEPLSHISEEDASALQRMTSSNTTAQLMRHNSNHSVNSTSTTASAAALAASGSVPITMYGSTNTTMTSTSQALDLFWHRRNSLFYQQQQQQYQQQSLPPNTNTAMASDLCSSAELSLLPLPPHDTSMSVLLLLQNMPAQLVASPTDAMIQWQIQSMSLTTLILGIVHGMINPMLFIYLCDVLDLSMWVVGLAAMIPVLADIIVHASARWQRREEWSILWLAVSILQVLQGLAFHLIWLAIVHRVSALLWTEEESFRIAQVGKLSALYSSIGPAIGVLLAGFLLSGNVTDVGSSNSSMTTTMLREGFILAYRCAIALTAASFVASWGWSTTS